jgi:hypothetical protein
MSEDHSADRARLLALVPADGSAIGNTALRRVLRWSEHHYWSVRDSLLEEGTIVRAKGRGGAVRRVLVEEGVVSETAAEAELVGEATLAYVREAELYPPIRSTLENLLVPSHCQGVTMARGALVLGTQRSPPVDEAIHRTASATEGLRISPTAPHRSCSSGPGPIRWAHPLTSSRPTSPAG